jgi:hypothetical protein
VRIPVAAVSLGSIPVGGRSNAYEIKDRRFATYILANAPVEELALHTLYAVFLNRHGVQ